LLAARGREITSITVAANVTFNVGAAGPGRGAVLSEAFHLQVSHQRSAPDCRPYSNRAAWLWGVVGRHFISRPDGSLALLGLCSGRSLFFSHGLFFS
jgi:hypothetical protein